MSIIKNPNEQREKFLKFCDGMEKGWSIYAVDCGANGARLDVIREMIHNLINIGSCAVYVAAAGSPTVSAEAVRVVADAEARLEAMTQDLRQKLGLGL